MNKRIAVELPDYRPEELSPLEQITFERQNKDDQISLAQRNEALVVNHNKHQYKTLLNSEDIGHRYVIKDMELYYSEDNSSTPHLEAAKQFTNKDVAEGFLKRKKDSKNLEKFLAPEIIGLYIKRCTYDVYTIYGY